MASFKVAFKQGFNLISIPLDMTGASYEDDPRELFPAYLRTSYIPNQGFEGEYMFERISNGVDSYINQDGEWKFVGESGSEWTSITTNQALSVFVNVPPNTTMVKKTFNGDTISSPNTIQYNLVEGWNIVSYPYEIDQDFGQGSYSTSAATLDVIIDFCLNNNYDGGELFFYHPITKKPYSQAHLNEGDLIMFPSNFLYPHQVSPIKKGIRYSVVAWYS